ncbi:AAA family ATPase [Bradyrhizobium sp. AUGA SZCCT0169]|uniref:AAA family ATPase n=1 Tax=Bradyrhizobium sp. AUGA SZCCT0169 TaxID=2807663 RepID=UPI001BAAA084|nr:AAA family ATPase [Bradyrhizobium sp. AUGA SZCCT0169]MBR1250005.1 AAA family ATPase [Bradyrhizobium sp. AUGA SZCCT0169]
MLRNHLNQQHVGADIEASVANWAVDDRNAPWMLDKKLEGITPPSRKASWLGEQRKRKFEALFELPTLERRASAEESEQANIDLGTPGMANGLITLPPLTISEWSERDLPEPDFLMGDWLTTTSRVLLTAATGLGKSNLGIALGMRVAAGGGFLHWKGRRPARVLYIDGEMSRRLLKQRVLNEAERLGISPSTFYALSHEDIPNLKPLNTPEGQAQVNVLIEKLGGVDLVIFDNIMSLTVGDMKDPAPWQQTTPWALGLTRALVGQIWIHHAGHDGTRSYGDKTREWQMDTVIHLDAVERGDTDVSFKMTFKKARERTPATRFDFQDVRIALVNNRWENKLSEDRRTQKISPQTRKGLEALTHVIAGDKAVSLSGGRRAAKRDDWEAECELLGLIDTKAKEHSARTIFAKFRRELVAANLIACQGDFSWIIG